MARDLFYRPLSSTSKLRGGSVPPVRISSIVGSRASLAGQTTTTKTLTKLVPGVRRMSVPSSSCVSIGLQRPTAGFAWSKPDVRRPSLAGSGISVRKFSNNNLFSPSQVRTRSSIAASLNRPLAQINSTALGNRKIFGLPVTANTPMASRKTSLDRRFSIPWNLNLTTTAHSKGYTPAKEFGVTNSRIKAADHKPVASAKTGRSSFADTDAKDFKTRDPSRIGRVSKKSNYEEELQTIGPIHEDSISKLRARAQIAKDHLCKHKILLDRYLPVQLGPDTDVVQEVENRYEELLSRMPRVQQQRSNVEDEKYFTEIAPYKPATTTSKDRMLSEIKNVSVKKSFTPKISDTRKRARSVLCKVKGDPRYYDF